MDNPYLEAFRANESRYYGFPSAGHHDRRGDLVKKYAWAIPTPEAIQTIADAVKTHALKGVVEMGAGTGYWGYLLKQVGVAYQGFDHGRAVDDYRNGRNIGRWTNVFDGIPEALGDFGDWLLLLCWPPYATPMATASLRAFPGRIVAYIGESAGGCTGDTEFHALLVEGYEANALIDLPRWSGIHDDLSVHVRNGKPLPEYDTVWACGQCETVYRSQGDLVNGRYCPKCKDSWTYQDLERRKE